MKNISIWKDIKKEKNYPKLCENKKVDVLIIGGGITGISTLYHLNNAKLKVMLVEQNEIGTSTTGNSTGKLTYLQNDLIDKIRKHVGDETASKYVNSQIDAIDMIKRTIEKENIDCDLQKVDSYIYTNKKEEIKYLEELREFLKKDSIDSVESSIDLVKSEYSFKVKNTYIMHPIKFLYGLLKNNKYPIYENTSIKRIEKENDYFLCYTDSHMIETKWVIIASHYPFFNLPFLIPIKSSIEKSYLSASINNHKPTSLISYSKPFISIRTYNNYLIYLSNTQSSSTKSDKLNFESLTKKLNDINLKPDYLWTNTDIMTSDGLPYIGSLKQQFLIGTGYNTWGLTNGFLAGKILSDIVLGKANEYPIFNPSRWNLSHISGGFNAIFKNLGGYINGITSNSDEIRYDNIDGIKVATYKEDENEYPVTRTCPHMGCKLIFNEIEKTWDCPCHGSKFRKDGKVLTSPANKDINVNIDKNSSNNI